MLTMLLLLIPAIIIFLLVKYKITVDFLSFFKKGFSARRGKFGVYCFCGKQGSGKTFSTVNFILKHLEMPVYSNVHLKDIDYTYYNGFSELLKIKDHHCIIVFDEIFSALTKSTRMSSEVLAFLSQMRKKNVIFITTAQEWLEINITLRRYVRYQIDCQIINILPFSILIEHYRDGEQMKWSNLDNEYIAPIVATKISKMMLQVTTHYDTWEVIDQNPVSPLKIVKNDQKSFQDDQNLSTKAVVHTVSEFGAPQPGSAPLSVTQKMPVPESPQSKANSRTGSFWQYYSSRRKATD